VQTLGGGIISVRTPYLLPDGPPRRGRTRGRGRRGKAGAGSFPVLARLGIVSGVTPALCEEATLCALNNTFDEAADVFRRRGASLSAKRIRSISEKFADVSLRLRSREMQAYREGASVPAPVLTQQRVAVCLDGGRINIRTPKKGRLRADAVRHGFHANWREPKLFTVYTLDERGAKQADSPTLCDGTIAHPDDVFDLLAAALTSNDARHARELVFLADGAPWIWNRLDALIRQIGLPADAVRKILDFSHAVQHLSLVADLLPGLSRCKKSRWAKRMKRLLRSSADDFLAALERDIAGTRSKRLRAELHYFQKNREHIRYRDFVEANLPIGSGSIESAIRRVVNLRLKGAGMFWLKNNAEGFLHLRCQTKTGNWTPFFQKTLKFIEGGVS